MGYKLGCSGLAAVRYLALVFIVLCPAISTAADSSKEAKDKSTYQLIQWTDLMPEADREALLNPPEYLNDIVDGSPEDQLNAKGPQGADAKNDPYQQALVSTNVRPEFDQRKIKVPGYIVPLAFDDNMIINEFFLVPFFGACIHVPPPPPNQMIYVSYKKGLELESLYDAYYVEGTLVIKEHKNDEMGTASYTLLVDKVYPYSE